MWRLPELRYDQQLAAGAVIFPWWFLNQFLQVWQARRLRFIQKEGLLPWAGKASDKYITCLNFRCKEKQDEKGRKKKKSHFTEFFRLSVVPRGTISHLCSMGMKGSEGLSPA